MHASLGRNTTSHYRILNSGPKHRYNIIDSATSKTLEPKYTIGITPSGPTLTAESPTSAPPPRVAGSLTLLMPALHGIYLLAAPPHTTQPAHWHAQGRQQNVSHGQKPWPGRPPSPRRRSTSYHSRARSLEPGVPPRRAFSTNQSTTSTTSAASNSSTGRRCACRNSTLARCSPPQHPLPDPGSRKRERRHGEQEHHHLPETVPSP